MSKTILMIHGMWGGSWYWDTLKKYFNKKGYQCHTPALRHHDIAHREKPHPTLGSTSLLDYAEDLEQYIRKLNTQPIIIGHSMGGLLTQILASRGLAKGIILLTPASPSGIQCLAFSVLKIFFNVMITWKFWKKTHSLSFNNAVYAMLHLLPKNEQQSAYSKLSPESGRAAGESGLWFLDPKKASKVDASKVTCPALVISGTKDRLTPASVVKKVAKKYNADYKEFTEHAHWIINEPEWEKIADYIYDWIKKNINYPSKES